MSTAFSYPHLTADADGTIRIGRTRYQVKYLAAEHFQHGWTAEELMRQHPDLRPEEVYSAMTYFYDHHDQLLAEIQQSFEAVRKSATKPPVSREELFRRVSSSGN